jgi:hypothetical protein
MGWFGKIMGGAFGLFAGGPLGAIAGATLGHVLYEHQPLVGMRLLIFSLDTSADHVEIIDMSP